LSHFADNRQLPIKNEESTFEESTFYVPSYPAHREPKISRIQARKVLASSRRLGIHRTSPLQSGFHDPAVEPGKKYGDCVVCDPEERRIGHAKEFYTNARGEPEYMAVTVGLCGLS
jgi:hypothetical protein